MKKKTVLSRFVAAALCMAMLVTALSGCKSSEAPETPAPTPSPSAAAEPEYIAAPYTAGTESPTTYVEPVFYENADGPTVSVTYVGVIKIGEQYFRDSNNNKELDPFEDWRLSTDERVADLLGKMTQDQRIGLLRNALVCSPQAGKAEDAYNADGSVKLEALLDMGGEEDGDAAANPMAAMGKPYPASAVLEAYTRSGVIRKDTDTETGALFNNALNLMAEWVGASKNEVTIPYMLISNPMLAGYPTATGFGAVAAGDGNYDAIQKYAELDAAIWDAKGIHQMYGPQIDLISDPRWSRNNGTYTEIPEDMAGIASALVKGYQHGTDGAQTGDVALIMKHFPGDGAAENGFESHYGMGQWRIYSTPGSLEKYQLPGFQAAIDAGLAGIMPAYSRPATDDRSVPQSYKGVELQPEEIGTAYNTVMLQTLLKETMGFDGFINSDSNIISNQNWGAQDMTEAERYAAVINAGCDVIGDAFGMVIDYTTTAEAVTSGGVTQEAFDRATTNRMANWIDMGMFDNPYRDPAESKKVGEDNADNLKAMKEEINHKSVVLMKNHNNVLPLSDASKKVYLASYTGKGENEANMASWTAAIEAMGFTIVSKASEADIAILDVVPSTLGQGDEYMHTLELVEAVEIDHVDPATQAKDGTKVEVTTVQDIKKLAKDASDVHANGGIVIASINITSPWILTNLEPHCDALLGSFGTSAQARMDVITGNYMATGKLPVTMVSCNEVIAVDENNICASPNDVPGYDKDQYIDAAVLAKSPSGSYAYQDADGNVYKSGFGLSMSGSAMQPGASSTGSDEKPGSDAPAATEAALVINYDATPDAFEGKWTLTGAYANGEMLSVKANACFLDVEKNIDNNKLVDEAAYIHADAVNLSATMTFDASISGNEYKCSSNWEKWTTVNVIGEGNCEFFGANQFKIRDDDEGVFFNEIAGVEVDELLNVIAVNSDGQLLVGYSDGHIENDPSATWEYVYIFSK